MINRLLPKIQSVEQGNRVHEVAHHFGDSPDTHKLGVDLKSCVEEMGLMRFRLFFRK